ncbi:MAG: type II secretion system protein E [Marinobacter sp. T13-3]|nr:MAG: type II secretion system protein E [Marinobacter sp. T13-3]
MSARNSIAKALGQILKDKGWITDDVLRKALRKQEQYNANSEARVTLGKILVSNNIITEEQLTWALNQQKKTRVVEYKARSELEELYGVLAYQYGNFEKGEPLVEPEYETDILVAENADGHPFILVTRSFQQDNLNMVLGIKRKVQALYPDIPNITMLYATRDVLKLYITDTGQVAAESEVDNKTDLEVEFESLIRRAYEAKAVDVHFFRRTDRCRVRFRIWGSLRDHEDWEPDKADDIISVGFSSFGKGAKYSHWKKNIRQRVRLKIRYSQHIVLDCRYEHSPGDDGAYHACIRILANDKRDITKQIDLCQLGFTRAQTRMIESAASASSGMVILSGPTGSGKSTTLAGVVKFINRNDDINVLTVESPIERELPAFQTAVSDDDDADPKEFARAIKSTLRRDPDVLLVGEIRDDMSASAAATGVQTGHTLLTTVHAQSAIEIVERMTSPAMGLPVETIASPSFISILIFQMLLPTLDEKSKIRLTHANLHEHLDDDEAERLLHLVPDLDSQTIYVRGKSREYPEGVSGMTICAEVVPPDEPMRREFRNMELAEAMRHWVAKGKEINKGKPLDERVIGLRASSHAVGKMLQGILDPRDVEAYFGHLNLLTNEF